MLRWIPLWLVSLLLVGCQSAQKRRLALVEQRLLALRPLSVWTPTRCEVSVEWSEPAKARYAQLFAQEVQEAAKDVYIWNARETSCSIEAPEKTPLRLMQKSFLENAMCLLMQVHYVNSPFDELTIKAEHIHEKDKLVQIRLSDNEDLGLFLDPMNFVITTKTKARGTFIAHYAQWGAYPQQREWRPTRLEHIKGNTHFVLDEIRYGEERVGSRSMPAQMTLSVGENRLATHSYLRFSNCESTISFANE